MFGWRARIGFIGPRRGHIHTTAIEMQMAAPEGVLFNNTFLDGPVSLLTADCRVMLPQVEPAARELVSHTPMDLILMGGLPVVLANGNDTVIRVMEEATGVQATTVASGMVNALRHLEIGRVVVVSPYYPEETQETIRAFIADSGFEIVSMVRGDDIELAKIKDLTQEQTYRLAKRAFLQAPPADGLLLVGGGSPVYEVLEALETDIGRPVVANNYASLWNALRMVHVREPIFGYGQLLTSF